MDVFLSSVIGGFEEFRAAAAEAVETLGHRVLRAEDFAASATTAQQACLAAVRGSDVVVVLLGERYGERQDSGLSPTHEEYREARERRPVLVFVQSGISPEPAQKAFIDEVQDWAAGAFRAAFSTPEELKAGLLRALHDHELATTSGPLDESEMLQRATDLLINHRTAGGVPQLVLAIAGGPHQQVLRPSELEDSQLVRDLQREALLGDYAVLDPSEGTDVGVQGEALVLQQREASLVVTQAGSIRISQPPRHDADRTSSELPALIAEDVKEAVAKGVRLSGRLLDRIDGPHRLTDVVILAHLGGASYMPWRTRAEHAANPTSGTIGMNTDDTTVSLTPIRRHRQALTHDADRIAEDLQTLLGRARTE